ncbi:serine/threonine-protein kinase [Streptomyces ardesiacus]|uniref:serine/threonine-protein kinase n=1 Tax=Streptomyces ardesiacus TaxID=285564 RepID=UPI000D5916CF|nr:serine/threonine-protein kinase [Streptomyces ardesiacus]
MGEVFAGRYELVDPVGRGGVGAVWRAWDHRRRRYVAAKVLQQRDAHSLLRFVREQALRIDHPHVLAPASWAADDDQVLFTMDLVTGGSLVHLVGDYGPLPPDFVCTLLDQLLSGLAAVHGEGVVHRDIKPANLLLEATGTGRPNLRLSDFGIAMRLGEPRLTETNLVVGTPGYLAPEQMLGAEPDFPADLFAVGLVALYLLEGAKPDAKALVQHFAEHGTPPAPRGVPEPLWQVVAALVQPDPSARFRTATGARKALAAAMELLPEPGPDDELIEIFDQVGPLPPGFGPEGPLKRASGLDDTATDPAPAPQTPPLPPWATPPSGALPGAPSTGTADGAPPPGTPPTPASTPSAGDRHPVTPGTAPWGGAATPAGTSPAQDWTPPAPDAAPPPPAGAPPSPGGHPPVPPGTPPFARDRTPSPRPAPPSFPGHAFPGRAFPGHAHPAPDAGRPPTAPGAEPTGAEPPGAMSETGSFHLPPPHPAAATAGDAVQHTPSTGHRAPHVPPLPDRALAPSPPQPADLPTAAYTARNPRPAPPAQHRGARRRRRSGPPAKVALPLLLLALACYAVGFWALARI